MAVDTDAACASTATGLAPTTHVAKSGEQGASCIHHEQALDIIDIRCTAVEINLKDEINTLFKPRDGPRRLPTLLLYDERGLQLFEDARQPLPPSLTVTTPKLPANSISDHIPG